MCAFYGDSPEQASRKFYSSPQHEHKNRLNDSGSFDNNSIVDVNPFQSRNTSTVAMERCDEAKCASLQSNQSSSNCDDDAEMEDHSSHSSHELLRMGSY